MIRWVEVKFSNYYKHYSYQCKFQDVAPGDDLVVRVADGELKFVKCIKTHRGQPPKIATKWILGIADSKAYGLKKQLNDKGINPCSEHTLDEYETWANSPKEKEMKGMENFSNKMMNRFFRKVEGVKWDLMSGNIGVVLAGEGIVTLEGTGEDAGTVLNLMDEFSMPIPAFAQNTPLNTVVPGDLIYQGDKVTGWVTGTVKNKDDEVVRFNMLTPSGNVTSWKPSKVNMMGSFDSGVMVLRSLMNMLPGGNDGLKGMQNMLLPMMMMGGGGDAGLENMMPMLLFSQIGADGSGNDAMGGNNMMQTMMMMNMFKGTGGGSGGFFN